MTESTGSQDYADKIAKLLAKAESATPAEAELLTAKAEQLMAKYSIDAAMLDEKRRKAGHAGEEIITKLGFEAKGSYRVPLTAMMWAIINTQDNIKAYQVKWSDSTKIYVVGYTSDVEQFLVLITSLEIQALIAMRAWWGSPETSSRVRHFTGSEKWNERRAFIYGFGAGVATRIRRAKAAMAHEPGTDLVLARGSKVQAHLDSTMNLKDTKTRNTIKGTHHASGDGVAAGKNANTGDKTVGRRGQLN